jgi:hypothetical protein
MIDDEPLPTFPTKWNGPPLLKPATVPFHPAAAIMPMLDQDEAETLVASIKKHGLSRPIVLRDDMILDGRNRYCACLAAGVEPIFEELGEFDDSDDHAYVIIHNLHRRHLSVGCRARLARSLVTTTHGGERKSGDNSIAYDQAANSPLGGKPKRTQADAALICGISVERIRDANRVYDTAEPEVVKQFEADKITLGGALFLAKKSRDAQLEDPRVKFAGRTGGQMARPDRPISDRVLKALTSDQAAAIIVKLLTTKVDDNGLAEILNHPIIGSRIDRILARRA